MSEEENDEYELVTLVDEAGEETDFAVLAVIEFEGKDYAILAPPDQLDDDYEGEMEIHVFEYKEDEEGGGEFSVIEDPDLEERVFAAAEELLFGDESDDEDDA
jgi:uncharacterized protein YrzB (UPF0473 family)